MSKTTLQGQELAKFFADALGADAILASPDTGRPYVKVGTKGDANLYLSVSLGKTCFHPTPGEGEEQKHIPVFGVIVRFFQTGGTANTFAAKLNVRATGPGFFRLDRIDFPLCYPVVNPVQSWLDQNVTSHLMEFVQGIANGTGLTLVGTDLLKTIIDSQRPPLEEAPQGLPGLFSLNPGSGHDSPVPQPQKAPEPPKDPPTYLN